MTIPKLVLDNQNDFDLLQQAYNRVYAASNGVLNAAQPGSALMALLEGQTFLTAELLWYLNLLPEALALEVFRLTGVERSPGNRATGTLTVYLDMPLITPFILSAGTVVDAYVLTEDLFIAPGSQNADVNIQARELGSVFNRKAYALSIGSLTTYMQGATNLTPIAGGTDLESLESYIERVQRSLRQRDTLVSLEDYQDATSQYIAGSVATTFPLITANKTSKALGHTHTFVAYPDRQEPTIAQCYEAQQLMQERVFIGSSVWVSPAEYYPLSLDVVVASESLSELIADAIYLALHDYMQPGIYAIGSTLEINELEYITRTVTGVKRVSSCFVNNESFNIGMPTYYTYPVIDTITITLVDALGRNASYLRGSGTGDTD